MKTVGKLLLLGVVIALASPALADTVKKVNCDKGQTVTKALGKADPGDTILVTGTCTERVTIITDRLTLDGQGSAILDGGGGGPTELSGVVTIDGAHGVTIKGFTVQHGPGEGIIGLRGATFTVQNTTVQDNAGTGIAVGGGSTADLADCTTQGNAVGFPTGVGLDVYTGSTVILRGTIIIAQNPGSGVNLFGDSTMELRGAQVDVNNNGAVGIVVGAGSSLTSFLFAAAQGSTLTVTNHGFAGLIVFNAALELYATNSTISAANNGIGIYLPLNGQITNTSPFGGAAFLLENNGVGLQFEGGSGAQIVGGPLTVQNNGTGILADGAGTLTLVSAPPGASSIQNNTGTDVDLKFGTRATLDGVAVSTITCDATVLSRGSTVCP